MDILLLVVKQCALNQSQRFWLLSNAFASTFTLCILMKYEMARIQSLN